MISAPPIRDRDPTTESPRRAWLRALELTAPIEQNPGTTLFDLIAEAAALHPEAPALLSDTACLSYGALIARCNQYARWAIANNLGRGDTVCLLMPNRPEYLCAWLGMTVSGCAVALLNTRLAGQSLAHCLASVSPSHVIVATEFLEVLKAALPLCTTQPAMLVQGSDNFGTRHLDSELEAFATGTLRDDERRPAQDPVTIRDPALYIYTSGTTGLPKAVIISHGRILQWSLWFAGLTNAGALDRLYNCLPMYHSVGGIVAMGPMLVSGGSVVIREGFSASRFWSDIAGSECTLFQYIGELCRYLLNAPADPEETGHRLRMCIGNGLRPEIWRDFKSRFHIPHILEFYAATEGNLSLFNVEGEPGALGRIPPFLAHRFTVALLKRDDNGQAPLRNDRNLCVAAAADEIGEAIGRLPRSSASQASAFEGYTSREETEKKIIRDVFKPGDAWFRTGDLMRRDARGYYYFVDRIGDTFRWKGENVSTSEVEQIICAFPGIIQASVYGVAVPRTDGRAGMAAVTMTEGISLKELYTHLASHLPDYACPLFLRLVGSIETTGTFRNVKGRHSSEGYDPTATNDPIYFNDRQRRDFVRLDATLHDYIQTGRIIL